MESQLVLFNTPSQLKGNDVFSDDDIPHLQKGLLEVSLLSAFGENRRGPKRKPLQEVWEWVFSDDKDNPFSYERCCLAYGVDPEELMNLLRFYKRKFLI